jgi:protein involved in polysaccharide export with SLBB domain
MTYAQARDLIKQRFAKVYDIKKSEIAISLSFVRLISVNLVGELISPGTYRFPAFTSAYNALVAISGPNNLGSLRNIYIKRNGQTIITLDLYEYLMNPDSKQDFFLENNDYIVVPTQGKIVNINGQSKRADNYELKENEGLTELLKYSGGLKGDALRAALHLKRYQNDKAIVIDVDVDKIKGTNFALQEGDTIFVAQIPNTLLNHVQLVGAARIPGYYEIKSGDRISDILQKAQGITEHADANRAFIERLRPEDKAKQLIPFNVDEVLKNPASPNNFMLQNLDTIRIMSAISAFDGTTIKVSGAVREEGEYPFALGMTLADVLYSAGGIKLEAANNRIEVLRVITFIDENTGQKAQNTTVVKRADVSDQLLVDNAAAQFKLQPYDHVYVRKSALFQDELMVKIYGEVEYPGEYSLINRDETLTQLIDRAGGLSGYAFQTGAKLYRWEDSTGYVLMDISKAMQKAELPHKKRKRQEALLQQLNYNYILLAGDSIFIPKVRNMVTLTGAMRHFEVDTSLHQISVPFETNQTAKDYVINYGAGYGRYAKKSRTYVKKANGEIKQTRRFLFFKKYPEVENGSTVFVDESDRHKRKKEQEERLKEYYTYHPKERPTANDTFDNIASKVTTLLTLLILIRQVSR